MVETIIALALAALVLLVPKARKTALEMLAVTAIAAGGIAALALPVWALYQAAPFLEPPSPAPGEGAEDGTGQLEVLVQQQEEQRRREEEERLRQAEEQRQREEEQARITAIAETVRSLVERERRYAAVSASRPRLPGADRLSGDLIAIRIPAWRDAETAAREKALIIAWLYAIGLTADEAASIHTANGWGSVYDLWRIENPLLATNASSEATAVVGAGPDPRPAPESDAEPEVLPEPVLPPAPEVLRLERPGAAERRAAAAGSEPRPESIAPRRPPPVRRPPPQPEVGPFGY
jgi:hypothetical protein